jgi:predicted RNA-binding protein
LLRFTKLITVRAMKNGRLREAAEDNANIRAYRAAKVRVSGEISRGEFALLEDSRGKRSRKRKWLKRY